MAHKNVALELKRLRTASGISLRKMADALGMAPSSYAHYENPERFKSPFLAMDIAIKISTLLQDNGRKDLAEEVAALAGGGLSQQERKHAAEVAEFNEILEEITPSIEAPKGEVASKPAPNPSTHNEILAPGYISAIFGSSSPQPLVHKATDESMSPTIKRGHLAMADTQDQTLSNNSVYLIEYCDLKMIKRVSVGSAPNKLLLISDNALFPPLEVSREAIHMIGKIVWTGGLID